MKKAGKGKAPKKPRFSFIGKILLITLVYALVLLIASALLLAFSNSTQVFAPIVSALGAASLACGYFSVRSTRRNGLKTALLACLPANVTVLLLSLAVNGFHTDITSLITFAVLTAASMLGGVLSANKRITVKK